MSMEDPSGQADLPKTSGARSRRSASSAEPYPGMMGDGTEEQNLNQTGDPSARIREDEVQTAFSQAGKDAGQGSGKREGEKRSFAGEGDDYYDQAKQSLTDSMSALTSKVNGLRDQLQSSADTARAWAGKQAEAARQLTVERPVTVVGASAGLALAVGVMAGFVIGKAMAEDDRWY